MDGLCAGCSRIVTSNGGCPYCGTVQSPKTFIESEEGHRKAGICRSNKCGRYDAGSDTCGILVERAKGGHVRYLYSHPETKCPNDPPMWNNEDDTVGTGEDKQERLGDALERTVEDRPTK
jgi:hypothetical protein